MSDISCTIKVLPQDEWEKAASYAIEINPVNAPAVLALRASAPEGPIITPAHLALLTSKYWGANGVRLTVGFLDNPQGDLRTRIISHMNAWGEWANVQFVESTDHPQVRIARTAGDGYWSYLGTDILHRPPDQPTMNLDSFTMRTEDREFHRVIRHETGHTLGFPHEHMRKEIVDRIDLNKALAYFGRTQGWSKEEVMNQVLTPFDKSALRATAQPDIHSIMCYGLPGEIMKDGIAVPGGTDIDEEDRQFATSIYPKPIPQAMPVAMIYEDANFEGRSAALQVGRYDIDHFGIRNDSLSSLKVSTGYVVTLYEHKNFQGRQKVFSSASEPNVAYVGDDFNDIASSLVVAHLE